MSMTMSVTMPGPACNAKPFGKRPLGKDLGGYDVSGHFWQPPVLEEAAQ